MLILLLWLLFWKRKYTFLLVVIIKLGEKLMGPFGIGDDAWTVCIDYQNAITAVLPEEVP